MPWSSRFLVVAVAFFLIAGAATAFIFLTGTRSISSDNVAVGIQGPVSIGSGDTVSLLITVKNDNPSAITNTNLIGDLPPGSRQATDKDMPFDHYTDTLGTLAPGEEASRTVNAVLFGAQNQALTIPVRVEYRAEGSNALFVTEGQYTVTVTSSPLSLTVSTVTEAASGQPFTLAIAVRSNASTPLENVAVKVDYPFGFTATNAVPKPESGPIFAVGTMRPGEQKTISITGVLTGSDADERVFRLSAGTRGAGMTGIALPYASTDALVRIARPFLATTLTLNRETSETVLVAPGESVNGTITWQNNLTVPVSDAQITVKFSGNGFDPSTVYTQSGFYRSSDATILFSKDTNRELAQFLPGDTGNGAFSFVPKSAAALKGVPNPTITVTVSIAGNRIGENRVPEAVSSTVRRTVKIGTDVAYAARAVRTQAPFTNAGPVPPRVGQETSYTIELSAVNSVNPLAGGSATMTLPSYVRYTGKAQGPVTYDERTRTVSWRVDELAPNATAKAYFQIALLPSASQNGTSPVLVSEQTFSGIDRFTQQQVSVRGEQITTQLEGQTASGQVTQ